MILSTRCKKQLANNFYQIAQADSQAADTFQFPAHTCFVCYEEAIVHYRSYTHTGTLRSVLTRDKMGSFRIYYETDHKSRKLL